MHRKKHCFYFTYKLAIQNTCVKNNQYMELQKSFIYLFLTESKMILANIENYFFHMKTKEFYFIYLDENY